MQDRFPWQMVNILLQNLSWVWFWGKVDWSAFCQPILPTNTTSTKPMKNFQSPRNTYWTHWRQIHRSDPCFVWPEDQQTKLPGLSVFQTAGFSVFYSLARELKSCCCWPNCNTLLEITMALWINMRKWIWTTSAWTIFPTEGWKSLQKRTPSKVPCFFLNSWVNDKRKIVFTCALPWASVLKTNLELFFPVCRAGLCLDKLPPGSSSKYKQAEKEAQIMKCFERSGDISLVQLQDILDRGKGNPTGDIWLCYPLPSERLVKKMQATRVLSGTPTSVSLPVWGLTDNDATGVGPLVETAIQRSPLLYIRNG